MVTTRSATLQARRVTRSSAAAENTGPSRANKRKAAAATNNHRKTAQKLKKTVPKKQSIPQSEPAPKNHAIIDADRETTINNDATIDQNANVEPSTLANKKSALHASEGTKVSDKSSRKVTTRPISSARNAPHDLTTQAREHFSPPSRRVTRRMARENTLHQSSTTETNSPSATEPDSTVDPDTELGHEGPRQQQVTEEVRDDYVGPSPTFNDDGLYYVAEYQMSFRAHVNRGLLRDAIDHLYTWEALNHGQCREVVRCYEAISMGLVRNYRELLALPLTHVVWTQTERRGITVIDAAREWFMSL